METKIKDYMVVTLPKNGDADVYQIITEVGGVERTQKFIVSGCAKMVSRNGGRTEYNRAEAHALRRLSQRFAN